MDLEFPRGDSRTYLCTITKTDGSMPSGLLSDAQYLRFYAKRKATDAAAVIFKEIGNGITIVSASAWTANLVFDPADTYGFTKAERLFWEIELQEASGTTTTVLKGVLFVPLDVAH